MKSGFVALFLLCSFLFASRATAAPSSFTGLVVTQIIIRDDQGNPWTGREQINDLIGVKPGDVFSGEAVRSGIALLYLKKTFQDIRVDGFPDQTGVRLEYTLIPVTVVDRIEVRGNRALSTTVIEEPLPNVEGREVRPERLAALQADLVALYQANGYFQAMVTFRSEPLPAPHRTILIVDIGEGAPGLISDITFPGAVALTASDLRGVMKSRIGSPFKRDLLLDTDRDAVLQKYAEAGYPGARIGAVSTGFRDQQVLITMPVNEGPLVTVRFTGNRDISASELRRALLIWSEHDISDAALDSSVDKIKSLYREQGYADVAVTVKKTEAAGRLGLEFVVAEGQRVVVSAIDLNGNTAFPTKDIMAQMALREPGWTLKWHVVPWYQPFPFREDQLEKDADNLRDRYSEAGYLEVSVKTGVARNSDGRSARVTVAIAEGSQTRVGTMVVEGNTSISAKQLLDTLTLKPGAPFNERLLDEDKYRILSAYAAKGYLFARVDVDRTVRDGVADIRFRVTEDLQVRIGRIILRGNEHTRDKVIMRELLVKPGEPYDYGAILASQQRIYRMGYFRLAKFEPVHPAEHGDTQDLLLSVEERPAGSGEVSFGYGDLDRLRGSVELGYRNLWGTAEYSSVRYEQSDILKRAIFNYQKPWFLERRLDAKFSLIWSDSEKLNSDTREIYYNTRKTAAAFGIEKTYEKMKPSLTYQFENVVNYNVLQAAMITSDDSGRVLVSSLSPALIVDLRDDVFNPHKGALYGVILKEALRELGSQADFSKLTLQAGWFFPIGRHVLALDARAGIGWPFRGTSEIPLHERFYVGGSTTVRGFTQDAVGPSAPDASGNLIPQGGDSMAVFNLELRLNPGEGAGFVLFTDAGNVWSGQELNITDVRASYGAGLRYGTPIGPLRIDYGQKIDRRPGESPGELHFNIGNTF